MIHGLMEWLAFRNLFLSIYALPNRCYSFLNLCDRVVAFVSGCLGATGLARVRGVFVNTVGSTDMPAHAEVLMIRVLIFIKRCGTFWGAGCAPFLAPFYVIARLYADWHRTPTIEARLAPAPDGCATGSCFGNPE